MAKVLPKGRFTSLAFSGPLALLGLSQRALAACETVTGGASGGASCAKSAGTPDQLGPSITSIVNTILIIVGVVAVIMLIIGGFRYVISQGNEKNISAAKDTILYAVVGLVVAILSYAIVNFVIGRF